MSDYLARLVQRAQNRAEPDIVPVGAPPRAAAEAEIDDPFETVGEPEPPVWPASRTGSRIPPMTVEGREAPRADAPPADPIAPTPAEPPLAARAPDAEPRRPLPSPSAVDDPFEAADAVEVETWSDTPEPPDRPMAPTLAAADAFMDRLTRSFSPARSPEPEPEDEPLAARESDRAEPQQPPPRAAQAPSWTPPELPAWMDRAPAAPLYAPDDGDGPLPPIPAEPRITIGRLTVTVEPPPVPQREVIVTRVVKAAPGPEARSGRSRPRFGLAQS